MKTLLIILAILAGAVMLIIAMYWLIKLLDKCRRYADDTRRIYDNERYISTKKERL